MKINLGQMLSGFFLGILCMSIGLTVFAKTTSVNVIEDAKSVISTKKKDYKDDIEIYSNVLEEITKPVFQTNYLLAGLTLSPEFQHFLEEKIEEGWWTEDYITQVLLDDLVPIYIDQYTATLKAILSVPQVQEIKYKLNLLVSKLKALPIDSIFSTLRALVAYITMLDTDKILDTINHLLSIDVGKLESEIKNSIEKLTNVAENVADALENLTDITVEDIINTIINQITSNIDMGPIVGKIKDIIVKLISMGYTINELLEDVDNDYHFEEGMSFAGSTLTKIEAKVLNGIDITVDQDTAVYSINGISPKDDTLIIKDIYVNFETLSNGGKNKGVDILSSDFTYTGSSSSLIYMGIPTFNNWI